MHCEWLTAHLQSTRYVRGQSHANCFQCWSHKFEHENVNFLSFFQSAVSCCLLGYSLFTIWLVQLRKSRCEANKKKRPWEHKQNRSSQSKSFITRMITGWQIPLTWTCHQLRCGCSVTSAPHNISLVAISGGYSCVRPTAALRLLGLCRGSHWTGTKFHL